MRRSLLQLKALLDQNQAKLDQDMALLEAAMQQLLLNQNEAMLDQEWALLQHIISGLTTARARQNAHVAQVDSFKQLIAEFAGHEVAGAVRNMSG